MSFHMRTSIHLPDDLLARARKKALSEGRTLTALIEEGLRIVVAGRPKQEEARRRNLPRVSEAKGGLLPGIDPVRLVQELDEQDDIARLGLIDRVR